MDRKNFSPNSRDMQAVSTKKIIFETAVRLFQKRSYDQVTVKDITTAAGVAKGTFYLYFETKEAILAERFHALDEHYKQTFASLPEAPLEEQLLYFLGQMCDYCQNAFGLNIMKTLYMHPVSVRLRLLSNEKRPFFQILRHFIHQGWEEKLFRTDISEKEMLNILVHSVRGLLYDWCLYNAEFDLVEECYACLKHTIDYLKKA